MRTILLGGTALALLTGSAFGADLRVPPMMPAPVPPFTWTSCYAGVRAGGGWGQKDLTDTTGDVSAVTGFTSANLDINGYMVGGQIGCDYQFTANWVAGIEGAASGGNIGNSTIVAVPGDNATFKETTDFLASVTGRVGYAWDRWMVYGKGGVAFVTDRYHLTDDLQTYAFDGIESRIGWTAGLGVEWAVWEDWSVKLEYDYYGFGQRSVNFVDSTLSFVIGPENIKQNIQVVMLGLNFHAYAGQGTR